MAHRHITLTEVQAYRRIQERMYLERKALRDTEPILRCFREKTARKITGCGECGRRYEDGTVIAGNFFPLGL